MKNSSTTSAQFSLPFVQMAATLDRELQNYIAQLLSNSQANDIRNANPLYSAKKIKTVTETSILEVIF